MLRPLLALTLGVLVAPAQRTPTVRRDPFDPAVIAGTTFVELAWGARR